MTAQKNIPPANIVRLADYHGRRDATIPREAQVDSYLHQGAIPSLCNTSRRDVIPDASLPSLEQVREHTRTLTKTALRKRYPREYNSWRAMKDRARQGKAQVAPEFEQWPDFLAHLGACPPDWSLDRKNADNTTYGPSLVRWASPVEQSKNQRRGHYLTCPDTGATRHVTDWARMTGQKADTMRKHIRAGWSGAEVISGRRAMPSTANGANHWLAGFEDIFRQFYPDIRPNELRRKSDAWQHHWNTRPSTKRGWGWTQLSFMADQLLTWRRALFRDWNEIIDQRTPEDDPALFAEFEAKQRPLEHYRDLCTALLQRIDEMRGSKAAGIPYRHPTGVAMTVQRRREGDAAAGREEFKPPKTSYELGGGPPLEPIPPWKDEFEEVALPCNPAPLPEGPYGSRHVMRDCNKDEPDG